MKQLSREEKLRLQVGLALMTGMFIAVPVTYGAPVHDANSGYNTLDPSKIVQSAEGSGVKTAVTGNSGDNVIAWKDFSVGANDKVVFDDGAKTNNYLNVVTGAATSQIDGAISGGKNVYIVNPNGVIFGQGASVDVGALYVSTENVASAVSKAAQMESDPAAVLQAGTPNADVVNMGSINATNVQVEGKNIRFLDSAQVKNGSNPLTAVVLNATGYAHVGNETGTSAGYSGTNLTDNYKLIKKPADLTAAATAVNTGATHQNYMLANDIDTNGVSFTPIGTSSKPFKGKFDGMFYEVQNLYVYTPNDYAGLFGVVDGGRIDNLGVTVKSVTSTNNKGYAGGLAGLVKNAVVRNAYSEGGTITTLVKRSGGLVGRAGSESASSYATVFENVYNTSKPVFGSNKGSGIIGVSEFGVQITNAYNKNDNVSNGITYFAFTTGNYLPKASYVYSSASVDLANEAKQVTYGVKSADSSINTYTGWSISADGTTNTPWRIYEGVSTPILTAFLKGTVTADYNYNYFANSTDTTATGNGLTLAGGLSGKNGGSDISAIYNAQYLKVADSTGTGAGTAADVTLTSNASSSDIAVNSIRNVNGNNLPQALISSGQHGYNIVGGNATINKRTVAAQSGTFTITKEYDGTTEGTTAFGQALSGNSGNVSFGGLLAGDSVSLSGVTATYDTKAVGTGKTVTVSVGNSPGLTGASAGNYTLDASSLQNLSVTGTITPRTLYLKLNTSTIADKTYDGTKTVTDTNAAASANVVIDTTQTGHTVLTGDDASLDYSNTLVEYDSKHAGGRNVNYANIALQGSDKGNYKLVVKDATSTTGYVEYDGSNLQATGKINQRAIDSTAFQVKDSSGNVANGSKTYDGKTTFDSTGYTLTVTGTSGVQPGDSINFSIVNGQANFQDASGNNTADATTSGLTTAATKIGYNITAAAGNNDTLLSDYTLNGATLDNTSTYTVSGTGRIEKRTINVEVTQPSTVSIGKDYDQTTTVKDSKAFVFGSGGYVDYKSGSKKLTVDEGVNDGVTLQVSAVYDSKDAGNRTIDYTATLNGTNAANYNLNNTGAITDTMLGTTTGASGVISPLNLSSAFASKTKTYDGTTKVTGMEGTTDLTSALSGVLSGDTVKLQGNAAYHSKNVKGDANGQNWIDYTNLTLSGTDAGNYTIGSSTTGAGTITAKTLGTGDFNYTFGTISKEYDGTTTLSNAGSYITGITVASTGDVIKDATVNHTSNVSGTYDNKNVQNGQSHTVNYVLTILDDGSGNYTIPSTGIQETTTATGTITPRTVIATIANKAANNTTKTYDANTYLIDGQNKQLSGDDVITFTALNGGTGLVTGDSNASTAAYKDQTGDTTKDAYAGTKDILYTAAINTADQSNYNIVDSNQQSVATLTGTGKINKRALTVTFGNTTKVYDGTADVAQDANHIKPVLSNDAGDGVTLDVTKVKGQYTGRTDNTSVGSNLDVSYSDLQQALGSYAENYTISDTGTGKGSITPLNLTIDNFNFDFFTITKEYDGTREVAYTDRSGNQVTAESFINHHYVDMDGNGQYTAGTDVLLQGIKATSALYAGSDSGSQGVTYTLILGNVGNFNIGNLSGTRNGVTLSYDATSALLYATTTGTITPREVKVSLDTTPTIQKNYDGTTSVLQNVQNIIKQDGLLGTDGTVIDTSVINARYDRADASNNRNVYYDVVLTGGNTSNYKLTGATGANYTAGATAAQGMLTGTGVIDKAPLTISFADVAKDYDGSDNVLQSTIAATLNGFVNGESDTAAETAISQQITGTYGTWDATNGVQGDANVNRQTPYVFNETYGYKGVVYQNINGALTSYVQSNSTAAARNYYIDLMGTANADAYGNTVAGTVADTLYFKEAAQKGVIRPLALTAAAIQERWVGPITKEYDGDAYVKNANGSLTDYLKLEATVSPNGNTQTINIPYTVLATNATYNGGKDVSSGNQGVTYKLSGLTAQAMGNFVIQQADADLFDIDKGGSRATVNSVNAATPPTTSITPKVIDTGLTKTTDINKVYDANDTADKSNAYYDVNDIVTADQGTVSVAVTDAYYADKTTGSHKQDASAMPGQGNNAYNVQYVFTLSGNAAGNYTLASGSSTPNTLTLTGKGDILKRKVIVNFGQGNDTGIDKTYDGGTSVDAAYKAPTRFTLSQESGDTGILQAEQNIVQLANNINAAYQSPHVQRKANGQVTTQDVIFSNFNLQGTTQGDGSANYYLEPADANGNVTLTGKGTITPLSINVSIDQAPTKEYDGNTALTNGYEKKDNILLDTTNLIGTDTINYEVLSADYADKNAGAGTKGYTYQLRWDNSDYDLVAQPTAAGETMQLTGYADGKVTGLLSGTNGTITPRILSVQSVADVTKEYDGTTGVENAAYNVNLSNRVISGDNIGLTATAQYDSADAGISEDSNELIVHAVNYKLNLSNGNYQLAQDTAQGRGTIRRKGLTVVAEPATINAGEAMPKFTGSVTGFVNGERDNYTAFLNGLTYNTEAGVSTSNAGTYGVYGWYRSNKTGLVGQNYTFAQDASNDSALTINYVNNSNGNPDTKITPSNDIYKQISMDMNSGFGDNGAAAIEYQDKGGNVIATENIGSGEINSSGVNMGFGGGDITDKTNQSKGTSHIGIVGGDIVNMDGAEAAGSANIEVSGNGTTVNLEVFSIEDENASAGRNAVAEITSTDGRQGSASIENVENRDAGESISTVETTGANNNSVASIEITDKKQDILEEEAKDKTEEQDKEGEIAIKSSDGEHEDEIELKVEEDGVNIA